MSDKIRINSIELENYRQYYGTHKIDFSSREEGFTVIAGRNGEGKSNLLNSISWCLYEQEPHGMGDSGHGESRSLSVINNRYITELGEEKRGKVSVKIWLEKGDTIYSISRILPILKHKLEFKNLDNGQKVLMVTEDKVPRGCEIIPEGEKFVIKEKGPNDSDFRTTQIESVVLMEKILPKRLSKYFLLDGEFLEGFWKDTAIIRNGIEQISQLHLLSSLDDHITTVTSTVSKGIDREIDSLTTRINELRWHEKSLDEHGVEKLSQEPRWKADPNDEDEYYHESGTPRQRELEIDREKMRDFARELSKKLSGGSSQNMKQLKNQKIELEGEIQEMEENREKLENTYRYNLITKSPYVFLKKAIEGSVSVIEERMSAGDLPIRQRRQFADDLLRRNICVCGESLDPDTGDHASKTRRDKISKYKETTQGKDDLDAAVDIKYDFRHEFLDNYDEFMGRTFGDLQSSLSEIYGKLDRHKHKLQAINQTLKNYGGEEAEEIIDRQEHILNEIQSKTHHITEIAQKLRSNSKELSELGIKRQKKWKQNQKTLKLAHADRIWSQIRNHIQQVYKELKDEIRTDIQNSTWKNFNELLANPTEFKTFTIESDYSVYMLDEHNINKIHNLSQGQSLILTLAFVAALREPTGYRFPLVVDSPLGKIDGGNRYNIGTRLPGYLPDEQLTLLVTDTEYTARIPPDVDYPDIPVTPVAELLEKNIGLKHFKINKERSGPNTGNSSIAPAELKHDKKGIALVSTNV